MLYRLAIFTAKGGTGKTTVSLELAAGLQKRGYRTLIMDMDCQGSASAACGINIEDPDLKTLKNILDMEDIRTVICHNTPFGDIVPNNLKLFMAEQTYCQVSQQGSMKRVLKAVGLIKEDYDFVIYDCPPSFGFTTLSALIASDYIIVPQLSSMFSMFSIRQLNSICTLIRRNEEMNPDIKILGVFLTKYNPRTCFSKEIEISLRNVSKKFLDAPVFDTKIRNAIAVEESFSKQKNIFDYASGKKIAEDFNSLVEEILARLNVPAVKEIK